MAETTTEPKTKRVSAYSFTIKGRIIIPNAGNSDQGLKAMQAVEAAAKVLNEAGANLETLAHFGQVVVEKPAAEAGSPQAG